MSYLAVFKNPIKVFIRYIIQKSLGKYLKHPLQLTNKDFSNNEIVLNDLQFNCEVSKKKLLFLFYCQVLNQFMPQSAFKIICCNVKRLSIKNWLSIQLKRNHANTPVDVKIEDIDVIIMPIIRGEYSMFEEQKSGNNTSESKEKNQSKQSEKEKVDTLFKQTLNEVIRTFLQNLQVSIDCICVRIMTREQTEAFQQIPTMLMRAKNISIISELKSNVCLPQLSDLNCLLNGKRLSVEEMSWHLMAATKIYKEIDYPSEESIAISESNGESKCPQSYPPINHPNTFMCFKSHQESDAFSAKFIVTRQQLEGQEITWCLNSTVNLQPIDVMFSIGQLYEILKIKQEFDDLEAQLKEREVVTEVFKNPVQVVAATSQIKHGKQSKQSAQGKGINFVQKQEKPITAEQAFDFNNFQKVRLMTRTMALSKSETYDYSKLKETFYLNIKEFADQVEDNSIEQDQEIQPIEDLTVSQEDLNLSEIKEELNISQVISNTSRQHTLQNMVFDLEVNIASVSITVLLQSENTFDPPYLQYDRIFKGQTNNHLHNCDYFEMAVSEIYITNKVYEILETKKVNQKQNPFGESVILDQSYADNISKTVKVTTSLNVTRTKLLHKRIKERAVPIQLDQFSCSQDSSAMFHSALDDQLSQVSHYETNCLPLTLGKIFTQNEQTHVFKTEEIFLMQDLKIKTELKTNQAHLVQVKMKEEINIKVNFESIALLILLSAVFNQNQKVFKSKIEQITQPEQKKKPIIKVSISELKLTFNCAHNPDEILNLIKSQSISEANTILLNLPFDNDQFTSVLTLTINMLELKQDKVICNSAFFEVNGVCLIQLGDIGCFKETKEPISDDSSSSEENFVIYEDDDDHFHQKKEKHPDVKPEGESMCLSVSQTNLFVCSDTINNIIEGIIDALQVVKGIVCFQKRVETYLQNGQAQQKQSMLKVIVQQLNFAVTKSIKHDQVCLMLVRFDAIQMAVQTGSDRIQVGLEVMGFIVLDFTQLNTKIYNQLLFQKNADSASANLSQSFFEHITKAKEEVYDIGWMCSASVADLAVNHEKSIVLVNHSCALSDQKSVIEANIKVEFDKQNHFQFTTENLNQIISRIEQEHVGSIGKINCMFATVSELEVDPMNLSVKMTIRDILVRIEALLSQKQDESQEVGWQDLQSSRFLFQINQDKSAVKGLIAEQTNLIKEFDFLKIQFNKIDFSNKSVGIIKELKQFSPQNHINVDLIISSTALDLQPVLQFKDYIQVFSKELKQINFLTFNQNLKFKISQRMVVFIQELILKVKISPENQSISVSLKNFSINILDQNHWIDQVLNPISLLPALTPERPILRLNDGTCTYLEFLGFAQIANVDCSEVKFQSTNESEEIQVNMKMISVYFAHDSFEALQKIILCTEHNFRAFIRETEASVKKGPKQDKPIQNEENKRDEEKMDESFQDISLKGDSLLVSLNEEAVKELLPLHKKSDLVFVIDQINAQNLRRKGQSFVPINELAKDNYIPVPKKVGVKQLQKYKKSHMQPKVNSVPNQVNSENFLQLKMQIQLHIQTIDLKLFQGRDFDFKENTTNTLNLSRSHTNSLNNSQVSRKSTITKKAKIVMDDQYLDPAAREEQIFYQHLSNENLAAKQISLRRQRATSRTNFHQILLKNILVSSFNLINKDYTQRKDVPSNTLYKFEKRAISIQMMQIKETISSKSKTVIDTFHLPQAYKYDNFLDCVIYQEDFGSHKMVGVVVELQPMKLKLRQEVLQFILDFFQVQPQQKQNNKKVEKKVVNDKEIPTYMKELTIRQTSFTLSYSSKRVQIGEIVTQQNFMEALNIFNINDLLIDIKSFKLPQNTLKHTPEQALQIFIDAQVKDIRENQKLNILGAIGPLYAICNITSAMYSMVAMPLESDNIYRDFLSGMSTVADTFTEEATNLRYKLLKLGKGALSQVGDLKPF